MKKIELKHPEYIQVNAQNVLSYGGNQNWFSTESKVSREYLLHQWGCGVIAIGDLLLYLARSNRQYATGITSLVRIERPVFRLEDYKNYIYCILHTLAHVIPGSGMNGFAVAAAVRRYCLKYRIKMTIAWKGFLDDRQMLFTIRKMLREDLPVILSIGPNTPLVFGKKGIPFYVLNEKGELIPSGQQAVHSHFVTVTGIVRHTSHQILLRIASWGKEYYIDYREYREYVNTEGDALSSSLLYLSKEDGTLF